MPKKQAVGAPEGNTIDRNGSIVSPLRKIRRSRDQRMVRSGLSICPGAKAERDEILMVRIMYAALELFSEKGYAATTIEEIAALAGLSKRSFFRYCPSKARALWADTDAKLRKFEAELNRPSGVRTTAHILNAYFATFNEADFKFVRARLRLLDGATSANELRWQAAAGFERAIEAFLVRRYGDILPTGFATTFASCATAAFRAAGVIWVNRGDNDPLSGYLTEAFAYVEAGFGPLIPPDPTLV